MKAMNSPVYPSQVERWGMFELRLKGPSDGNPFTEHKVHAVFTGVGECKDLEGFYDGDGIYIVRFMPSYEGCYTFELETDFSECFTGKFQVVPAGEMNHGMVRVANTWHFAYEDGTPYYSIGTTCYVWAWQSDMVIQQTLKSLRDSAFNKIRFCVFPKHYDYNLSEPRSYPYEGTPMDSTGLTSDNFYQYTGRVEGNEWDFSRFNPAHFRHLDWCISQLKEMGIEADLILFHPYDRWGFSCMKQEDDIRYIRYMVARYAAFRNVWWSLANEYDLMYSKTWHDWKMIAQTIYENDPYKHLRSIHNCAHFYDHNRPWISHCSIQRQDLYKSSEMTGVWRDQYRKPVVLDEICYEGDIQHGWGNISGEELVRRFWEATVRGGYAGHGETYLNHHDLLWWSHGGTLHGESHQRFSFLLNILKQTPGIGLCPSNRANWDEVCAEPQESRYKGSYYLYYYGFMRPSFRDYWMDGSQKYEVHVLDTWEMTNTLVGVFSGSFRVQLPGKPYMAVQIKRVDDESNGMR